MAGASSWRRGILGAAAVAAVGAPFLGFRLAPGATGASLAARWTDLAGLRLWTPCWMAAALLALLLAARGIPAGWMARRAGGLERGLQRLTTPAAGALWLALAVAFPCLPEGIRQDLAGWEWGGNHPLAWLTLETLTNLWLYVVLALGLNLIVGQAGVLVLGYGGFYAVGAYAMALLATGLPVVDAVGTMRFPGLLPYWWAVASGILGGALLAALAGALVGFPALRLKGDYLAIVTLGFGEALVLVLRNWTAVTAGTQGVNITPALLKPLKGSWAYPDGLWHYALGLAAAAAAVGFHARLNRSRFGRSLVAVREDETAARAMGIDAPRLKLQAFALAAAWAGVAGALFAARLRFVTPEAFTFLESVTVLVMVVLGGMGNLRGVVLGAVSVTLLMEMLRGAGGYRMLVFGALLAAMMIYRPQGLLQERRGTGR